ncbi:hypothetical protein EJ04DRAFT_341280 [Polyplosphaeria fusca]|uniref:Uncharacterized protein n=1 Tax=Polyplosphaeria fusca TaxID=682080 RepID=A0A9P4QR12_9PLEO|nr:hypothetical protein EJ04DRAFT_341280 [Polyplosphaeria fusca]
MDYLAVSLDQAGARMWRRRRERVFIFPLPPVLARYGPLATAADREQPQRPAVPAVPEALCAPAWAAARRPGSPWRPGRRTRQSSSFARDTPTRECKTKPAGIVDGAVLAVVVPQPAHGERQHQGVRPCRRLALSLLPANRHPGRTTGAGRGGSGGPGMRVRLIKCSAHGHEGCKDDMCSPAQCRPSAHSAEAGLSTTTRLAMYVGGRPLSRQCPVSTGAGAGAVSPDRARRWTIKRALRRDPGPSGADGDRRPGIRGHTVRSAT